MCTLNTLILCAFERSSLQIRNELRLFSFQAVSKSCSCVGFVKKNPLHFSPMIFISPPFRRSNWKWRRAEEVEAAVGWLKMRCFLRLQVFSKDRKTCWLSLGSSYLMPRDHWSVKIPNMAIENKKKKFLPNYLHTESVTFCFLSGLISSHQNSVCN